MNKGLIILSAFVLLLGINLVSAGNYWSYHDDYRYTNYNSYGSYNYNNYNEKYEYTKTIKTKTDYDWDSYKTKTTITEKREIKRTDSFKCWVNN